jgi:Co/Zn/Cd efflux system component
MSAAQLLIGIIGLGASVIAFVLMRFPQHRREQYYGRAFSLPASLALAAVILVMCLIFVWAQGRFEAVP